MASTGKLINQLPRTTSVPEGSYYVVEMGDGTGTKGATHETVVNSVLRDLPDSWGGTLINVSTVDPGLYDQTVTLTGPAGTMTAQFSSDGKCKFTGVSMTGTLTLAATSADTGKSTSQSIQVDSYSTYSVSLDTRHSISYISVTTTDTGLYGRKVTATNGTNSSSATFSSAGKATLTIDFDGTVTVTASTAAHTYTDTVEIPDGSTETYEVKFLSTRIYGVLWDGTSSSVLSRTDEAVGFTDPSPAVNNGNGSSPFDDIFPWSGMKKVEDATAGTLVEIPKFWYKIEKSGSQMSIQIADGEEDGFHVSPLHADRGDGKGERDVAYVGRYHCATSTYKSTTGVKPQASQTRAAFRSAIANLASDVWQFDYAALVTIWLLYIVEYANWNSQAVIGYGCGNNSGTENAGLTDAMTYHTGTNAASRTTYGHVQYRYIEDLWGNVYDWCDGIYFSGTDVYCIKNPSAFSDTSGGTKVGTRPASSRYISEWSVPSQTGYEYAIYPSAVAGTEATYVGDYCYYDASGVVLFVGGSYSQYQSHGLFYLGGYNAASYQSANIGSRLLKLP